MASARVATFTRFRRRVTATAALLLAVGCEGTDGAAGQAADEGSQSARAAMVRDQIEARGIRDARLLEVMRRVPRHVFVPTDERAHAYDDSPVPIGFGQTISQPYIVAYMTDALALSATHTVLEIGTGSGYQAAVLAELAQAVYSVELVPELADRARRTLADTGYRNVEVRTGNGYLGWPERAPFDRIIVTAAPPELPRALVDQLAGGGVLVAPVGTLYQEILIVRKTGTGIVEQRTIPVRFVPMVNAPR